MNLNLLSKLPQGVSRTIGKLWLKTKNASPEICVIGGMLCGAGAIVLVGVKTWKHKETLKADRDSIRTYTTEFVDVSTDDEAKLTKKQQKKIVVHPETGNRMLPVKIDQKTLSEQERTQLIARRIDFARDIVKTYWLPATLEVGSVVLIWKGRSILRDKLSAMTAAYAAVAEAYRKYREKVAKEIGTEREQELAYGYSKEEHVDENGNVQQAIKAESNGNRNPYGFWVNEGFYDETGKELLWRNHWYKPDKKEMLWKIREQQELATRELRTIGYWRLGDTMIRMGMPPKEAAKFHDIGKVWSSPEDKVDFGVLEGPTQLPVNAGFTDFYCSQNICYINPNVDGYIGYINEELEKYDFRYSRNAGSELPYKSFNREANRLIERYNKEKMEQMIFNSMSDSGKRKMAKILK